MNVKSILRSSAFPAVVVVVLLFGAMLLSGSATPVKATEETSATTAEDEIPEGMVEYLFVQHADGVNLENGVLTLKGVGDTVLYFSDRPHRIVGRESLEEFLEAWDEGQDSFEQTPPNAVLTVKQEGELRDLVVVLKSPVLTDGNLAYQVEVLDGLDSGSGAFAALFIDVIGDPISGPRGEVRRTARRTSRRTARRVNRREDVRY